VPRRAMMLSEGIEAVDIKQRVLLDKRSRSRVNEFDRIAFF